MRITLKINKYCSHPPNNSQTLVFDSFPIILGRSNTCHYVLPDASRYISSNHASILLDGENLLIQDTSANGLYINGDSEPVGRGRDSSLNNEDLLAIGDYILSVSIEHTPTTPALVNTEDPLANSASECAGQSAGSSLSSKNAERQGWPADSNSSSATRKNNFNGLASSSETGAIAGALPLLSAAALRESDFAHRDSSELLEQTGRLLSQLTDAMMVLLQSRVEIKNAIRSDVTTISQSGNNPLKISHSTSDALTKLLADDSDGYLRSEQAIQEAVEDLKLHQLAMLEGMKSAVKYMLQEFDPDKLAHKLEGIGGISANIPITREAKLWQLFCKQYDSLSEEALGDFGDLFGTEFRKAYEVGIKKAGSRSDI